MRIYIMRSIKRIRIVIAHGDNSPQADELKNKMKNYDEKEK